MKVSELIEVLKQCPPNATIAALGPNDEFDLRLVTFRADWNRVFLGSEPEEYDGAREKVLWQDDPES